MKRLIFILLAVLLTTFVCDAKTFYYDGVGFNYGHGWKFSGSPTGILGVKDEFKIFISKKSLPENLKVNGGLEFATVELEKKVDVILEQTLRSSSKKLKSKSEIQESDVNGIPAVYVDFKYSKGEYQRHYCFEWNGYVFDIELTGKGGKFVREFDRILSSFAFTPELQRGMFR